MADSSKSKIMWSKRFLIIYTLVKLKVSAFLPKKKCLVKLNSSWWLSHPFEMYAHHPGNGTKGRRFAKPIPNRQTSTVNPFYLPSCSLLFRFSGKREPVCLWKGPWFCFKTPIFHCVSMAIGKNINLKQSEMMFKNVKSCFLHQDFPLKWPPCSSSKSLQ